MRTFIYIWRERESQLQMFFKSSWDLPKMVETMSSIPYALNSMSFLGYFFHQAGSIFPPLESEHVCDLAVLTLSNKMTVLSHKNLRHFHLVLLECSCWTQPPYCEEAQRAVIKQPVWRTTKTSIPQLHSAPDSPCERSPFKVDLLAPS